jgi:transposase-like protein
MEIKTMSEPKSLQEAVLYFSNPDNCLSYLVARRWPNGVVCPTCGSSKVSFNPSRRIWQCGSHHAKRQFSVKVGTIFEDSPIPLDKWMVAVWMIANCKNGVSSYEVARAVKITQKSAWFMMHRVRLAMQDASPVKLGGKGKEVEVDEAFIGGRSQNMHRHLRDLRMMTKGDKGKTPVLGILERGGRVHARVIGSRKKKPLQAEVREHVAPESSLYTDALPSYEGLIRDYSHYVIDHAVAYVDGKVHTNSLENFWSLLKRGLKGTYVSVEPFHLFRYLDEQSFRFNNRELSSDGARFSSVLSQVLGKRLTWDTLTGKSPDGKYLSN